MKFINLFINQRMEILISMNYWMMKYVIVVSKTQLMRFLKIQRITQNNYNLILI